LARLRRHHRVSDAASRTLELGAVARAMGAVRRAASLGEEALRWAQEAGDPRARARALELLAAVAVEHGEVTRGVMLLGAAEAWREALGAPLTPLERPAYERAVAIARDELGEATFAETWAQGRALSLE